MAGRSRPRLSLPASTPSKRSCDWLIRAICRRDFRRAVARIDYSSASAKINLALGEPPQFTAVPQTSGGGIGPHHHGTIHISPTLDYLEAAFDDAKYGRPSAGPILEITLPTSLDRTIAPPGKHVMSMFVQYAPYRLAAGQGTWDEIKEEFADRCIDVLAEYAPNVPGAIEHRQVLSPLDLGAHFRSDGRQHHARRDERRISSILLPSRRRLGRSPFADPRPILVRRGEPPGRRRDGHLRQERRRRNPPRHVGSVGQTFVSRSCPPNTAGKFAIANPPKARNSCPTATKPTSPRLRAASTIPPSSRPGSSACTHSSSQSRFRYRRPRLIL